MSKTFLHPEYRSRMRDLIQGFIEHCEFSDSLVGQIERFFYFQGRKYGLPTFTISGQRQPGSGARFVNLVGVNDGDGKTAAETLLQLIERLAIQPHIAAGHILRVLPVSDPLGLELGESGVPAEVLQILETQVDAFRNEPAEGLIEVHVTGDDTMRIHAQGPATMLGASSAATEALQMLQDEDFQQSAAARLWQTEESGPWILNLAIPRSWPSSLAVHWTSQFLVVFLRAHATALRRTRSVVAQ